MKVITLFVFTGKISSLLSMCQGWLMQVSLGQPQCLFYNYRNEMNWTTSNRPFPEQITVAQS